MAHLTGKNRVERANAAVLLGTVGAPLAICVLVALAYDIRSWFSGW